MSTITLRQPDDMHLHLRDGGEMQSVVLDSARQFARAIIMPNLQQPIITIDQALAYRGRICAALGDNTNFDPLMTLYLTDNSESDEIIQAKNTGHVFAVKYYPAGATTNSDSGVTRMENVYSVLETMEKIAMPLLLHGEVTDSDVDIFDREAVFIDRVLEPLRKRFPALKIVLEHITTKQGVEYIQSAKTHLAATITPQHCLLNRNALFAGGLRPHNYCLPVLKAEQHRLAIFNAATSGDSRFFLGTDSAPHSQLAKENTCGCAGIYSALCAVELYTEIFEQADALDHLQAFASENGARFYDLPLNTKTISLEKNSWTIPTSQTFGGSELIPFRAGESISWKMME